MQIINNLTSTLLILIPAGTVLRIIICAIQLMGNEDEKVQIKKRLRHTIVFLILALTVIGISKIIMNYYK